MDFIHIPQNIFAAKTAATKLGGGKKKNRKSKKEVVEVLPDVNPQYKVEVVGEGNGVAVEKGSDVIINYTGHLGMSVKAGSVFDTSVDKPLEEDEKFQIPAQPRDFPLGTKQDFFEFKAGQGDVIRGLDQGLMGLTKGQKAKITCPPEYAYGPDGLGVKEKVNGERPESFYIPQNTTMEFNVEVVDVKAPAAE